MFAALQITPRYGYNAYYNPTYEGERYACEGLQLRRSQPRRHTGRGRYQPGIAQLYDRRPARHGRARVEGARPRGGQELRRDVSDRADKIAKIVDEVDIKSQNIRRGYHAGE